MRWVRCRSVSWPTVLDGLIQALAQQAGQGLDVGAQQLQADGAAGHLDRSIAGGQSRADFGSGDGHGASLRGWERELGSKISLMLITCFRFLVKGSLALRVRFLFGMMCGARLIN